MGDLAVDAAGALRQGRGGSRDLFEPSRQSEQSAPQKLENLNNTSQNGQGDPSARQRIADIGKNIASRVDNAYSSIINRGAVNRLASGIEKGADGNVKFVRLDKPMLAEINSVREAKGLEPLTQRQVIAYKNAINNNLANRYHENPEVMTPKKVAEIAYDSLTNPRAEVLPGKGGNTINVAPYNEGKYNSSVIGLAQDGGTSLKSIEPRSANYVEAGRQQKSDLLGQSGSPLVANQEGGVTQTGTSLVDQRPGATDTPLGTRNSIVAQNDGKVNTQPDIRSIPERISDFGNKYGLGLTDYTTILIYRGL